jgi:hypothetical protein
MFKGVRQPFVPKHDGSWVYFIQSGNFSGPIKIGVAKDPGARLAQLQVGNPDRLRLRLIIPGTMADEGYIHSRLSAYRIGGEWFRYDGALRFMVRNSERLMRNRVRELMRTFVQHCDEVKEEAQYSWGYAK